MTDNVPMADAEHNVLEGELRASPFLLDHEAADAIVALRAERDALAEELAVANNELAVLSDASALAEALCFYANPETYFACAFWFDPPTGGFDDDFDEDYAEWTDHDFGRFMPGKTARAAIRARLNGGAKP